MMSFILGLTSLIVITGVPLLIHYFVTRKRPRIVYFLSNFIPADFNPSNKPSYVQQLEIRNTGNIEATKIIIKIPATVSDVRVIPFSQSHEGQVNIVKVESGREITYPDLIPEAQFQVVLKSAQPDGLQSNEISVFHKGGQGIEATATIQNTLNTWSFAVYILIILGFSVLLVRSTLIDSLKSQAKYNSEEILTRAQPWYCTKSSWNRIYDEAISVYVVDSSVYVNDLVQLRSYRILNDERLQGVTDATWTKLAESARGVFVKRAQEVIRNRISYAATIQPWLMLQKPPLATHKQWEEVRNTMMDVFESRIFEKTRWAGSAIEVLETVDLTVLPPNRAERIQGSLYQIQRWNVDIPFGAEDAELFLASPRPKWMHDKDYVRLIEHCERLQDTANRAESSRVIRTILSQILNEEEINASQPEELNEDSWNSLSKLYDDFTKMRADLERLQLEAKDETEQASKESRKLATDSSRATELLRGLERKLAIINNVLDDPNSIDEIEVESNPFAPGNWANLQKVAKILRSGES